MLGLRLVARALALVHGAMSARTWCPGCEPDRDPLTEILIEDYCGDHRPSSAGLDDGLARVDNVAFGGLEAHGEDCRRAAALIHRGKP